VMAGGQQIDLRCGCHYGKGITAAIAGLYGGIEESIERGEKLKISWANIMEGKALNIIIARRDPCIFMRRTAFTTILGYFTTILWKSHRPDLILESIRNPNLIIIHKMKALQFICIAFFILEPIFW